MHNDGCPFCETVKKVLLALDLNKSEGVRFEILHSVMTQAKDAGYMEGYTEALKGQVMQMIDLIDDIEDGCDCDECKN